MKVYMYAGVSRSATPAIIDLAQLWDAGILSDDSTVWVNTVSSRPALWALTDKSQLIYIHRCTDPGYVRLGAGRARWARTHDGSREKPQLDLRFDALPGGGAEHITVVIAHQALEQTVGVIAGHNAKRMSLTAGSYSQSGVTVIDLPAFRAHSHLAGKRANASHTDIVRGNAAFHGLGVLTEGLSDADRALVQQHLEAFEFDIESANLHSVNEYLRTVEGYAGQFQATILRRLHAAITDRSA
ncbi:hypothetical protein [Mycolicibacterium llatzerense]|uniref:hypothetical protein n=1 Tax=Mycolicibacterium llatzerense TaxID=280871 RepID=UPI0008DE5DD6|nr:hypothetical protein [Mycolicibacterium llatzerense]